MKQTAVTMVVAMATVWSANATVVTLSPDADADIRSAASANVAYDRNVMVVSNKGTDPSITSSAKAYIRFKLPTDFGSANSATFTITRSAVGAFGTEYTVNGLDDGVAGELDWVEQDGSGMNWNDAPGNITTSPNGFTDAALVGAFTTTGGVVGDSWSVSGTDLVDFLNADTNGYVTLMIGRTGVSSSFDTFASAEHASLDEPELTLDYTPNGADVGFSVLTPDADADIRSATLATNAYDRMVLKVGNEGADPSITNCAKAYIRYKLPADFGSAVSATFTITRTAVGAWGWPHDVSGLDDGISGELDWVEQDGSGMNWNDAPGNLTNSPNAFTDSVAVGSFTTTKTANGGVVGDSWSITGTALVDFLNADANGYVTLMIGRSGISTSFDTFSSKENTNNAAPTLSLEYLIVPAFSAWIGQYPGVGSATNKTDNPDGDSLDNLSEWALGGNPDDAGDIGHVPVSELIDEGGTNWFTYVYAKRNDAAALGLTYTVEQQDTDLIAPSWTTNNYEFVGSGGLDAEFDTVTNRMPTGVESKQFLRLLIESN